ncbi:hypothetical protein [Flavobacterium macrobrachii]|jgi:hypothetical protein|uniref:hypothetical protein n=1 Tax=Flavobacterium macrobrachii TaxID=591204 RepID=UPI003F72C05F
MKKQITFAIVFFSSLCAFAQVTKEDLDNQIRPLTEKIATLQSDNSKRKSEIETINSKLSVANNKIASLQSQIEKDSIAISQTASQLGIKIKQTETTTKDGISKLDKDVEKNRLYWIIATLVILLLGGLVYRLLRNKISNNQTGIESQILEAKLASENKIKQLDDKLVEIYDKQLKIVDEVIKSLGNSKEQEGGEKDHSLVLKVADEVTKIQMNLEVMDKEIRGYKHLKKYSETILDNLKAYGYEIPQLIGINYNSGMNMVATLEFDESIESGKQIIKRIIKPQVNFEGKMIQAAKVTVAFNE